MSFRNWLIRLLGGSPPNEKQSGKIEASLPADRPIVLPDLAILNQKSLILSNDARTIYLIDKDGKSTDIDLTATKGGTIGLVKGQLSLIKPIKPAGNDIDPFNGNDDILLGKDEANSSTAKQGKKHIDLRLEIKDDNEYTLSYNASTRSLSIAGATAISDDKGDLAGDCALHLFSLRKQHVNFKFDNGLLLVEAVV